MTHLTTLRTTQATPRAAWLARLCTLVAAAAGTPVALASQTQHLVVPPSMATSEGNGAEAWVAAPFTAHRQLILDATWLQSAIGKELRALSIRRNQGTTDAQVGGMLMVEVSLAHAAVGPADARADFAANRGEPARLVFQGPVTFPAASVAPSTPAPWQSPFAVTIPFTVPFPYRGGPLVVETHSRPIPGSGFQNPWWPIDAVIGPTSSDVQPVGQGCLTGTAEPAAGGELGTFVVGGTGTFWLRGLDVPTPVICMLGASDQRYLGLPLPIDLAVIGMPGCRLYQDIAATFVVGSAPWQGARGGLATMQLPIPNDTGLVGAAVLAQWIVPMQAGRPRTQLSNGVRATLGAQPSQPGAAWVEAVGVTPSAVRVLHDRCPVLRLEHTQ